MRAPWRTNSEDPRKETRMSDDQNTRTGANPIVIVLVVAVVVLAAGLGYVIWKGNDNGAVTEIPANSTTSQLAGQSSGTTTDAAAGTAGTTGGSTAAPADFDPASATKVPEGTTPEQWVTEYYTAADGGDWETAFNHLPAAKQAGSSPQALQEQVAGYGVVGFTVVSATEEGDKATVIVDQETGQYGTFENTWVFVKDGGAWLVQSKAVTGMK
jgi:hypothetical protein